MKKVIRFKKEFLIVMITSLVVGIATYQLRKPEIKLAYPHIEQLPSEFTSLNCNEVSVTYMRVWPQDSDLPGDANNSVQLSVGKSNTKITLTHKDGKVIFNGDYVWNLENRPFIVDVNNPYRMAGTIAASKEETPRYDIAGSFMLDKRTSLLILSDTDTMITQNESFGTRSRLFTCKKAE